MKIAIAGASGFVGTALVRFLLANGHTVTGLATFGTHHPPAISGCTWIRADTTRRGEWQAGINAADAVINLTGRTIFKRWTSTYKTEMIDSRVKTTRHIVAAMRGGPRVLLSTSAVGYYGDRGDESLTEASAPGSDFLARLAVDWEAEARAAEPEGIRVAIMRFGVVLGRGGGALAQMLPAFRRFAGGPIGRGRQWFPWIHLADLLAAVDHLLHRTHAQGAYNVCAPGIVRQKEFARALGEALGRPAVTTVPPLALRVMLGAVAGTLTASQKAVPQRLLADGFTFRFGDLSAALADLVRRS